MYGIFLVERSVFYLLPIDTLATAYLYILYIYL
jgi:hypothetical protein